MKLFRIFDLKKFQNETRIANDRKKFQTPEAMPGAATNITDREKAAILAFRIGLIQDAKTAFIAAHDSAEKDVPMKSINSYVSKWMHSDKVQGFLQYVDRLLADRDSDARQRGREEAMQQESRTGGSEPAEAKPGRAIDYYDPTNQRRQINKIIQEASDDPKTQLDAIKAIQQTQRDDRQAARDQKQAQSYLPLRCNSCPLMEKARKKAGI